MKHKTKHFTNCHVDVLINWLRSHGKNAIVTSARVRCLPELEYKKLVDWRAKAFIEAATKAGLTQKEIASLLRITNEHHNQRNNVSGRE